ncbi:MAG: hypothetical protein SF123_09695 [Chloroflexota bacterium]|nr:hypothetical protein [Chloroflexota bacterium]
MGAPQILYVEKLPARNRQRRRAMQYLHARLTHAVHAVIDVLGGMQKFSRKAAAALNALAGKDEFTPDELQKWMEDIL